MMFKRDFREDIDDRIPLNAQPVSPTAAHFGTGDVGWSAFGPAIAFSTLATLVVALRWYTRCRLLRCIFLDDYVILLSLVSLESLRYPCIFLTRQALSWTMCGIIGAGVREGVGEYRSQTGVVHTRTIAELIIANNSVWAVCINITKASILTQYLRVFSGRKTMICCWTLMSALFPAACWGVFGGIFLCSPTAKLWNPELLGHCRNSQTYWVSVAAVDIILDFSTLLLPLPSIAGLRLPRKQKFLTMLVFLLGFMVCVVSVTRLTTVVVSAELGDYIMSGIWSIIWSVVEANVGIVCASLLPMKSLLVKVSPKLLEETELPCHAMQLPKILSMEPRSSSAGTDSSPIGTSTFPSWPPPPARQVTKAGAEAFQTNPRPQSTIPGLADPRLIQAEFR